MEADVLKKLLGLLISKVKAGCNEELWLKDISKLLEMGNTEYWSINSNILCGLTICPNINNRTALCFSHGYKYLQPRKCPICGSDTFKLMSDGVWECSFCNEQGIIQVWKAPRRLEDSISQPSTLLFCASPCSIPATETYSKRWS